MKLLVEWSSKSLVLEPKNSYLIGRDEECALFIDSSKVSRRHARLFFKNGNWVIQDLNSSNGTLQKAEVFKKYSTLSDNKDFLQLLVLIYDDLVRFNVTSANVLKYKLKNLNDFYVNLEWGDFDHSNDIF